MAKKPEPKKAGNLGKRKPAPPKKQPPKGGGANKESLTLPALRFADEYLIDFNATQAAIRAGYSEKTAGQIGYELLKKPEIQRVIAAKQKELAHKAGITRERIVAEAARLAFSDLRKVFDEDGNLLPIHMLPDDVAAAISTVELIVTGSGDNVVATKKIKLWDKNSALEKLLKHLGMDGDKDSIEDRLRRLED